MNLLCTWNWNWFYVSYWVKLSNGYWVTRYYKLKARNKRHARKVFFKFVPKNHKKTLCKLRISGYMFTPEPSDFCDYDGVSHFWDMSPQLG